MKIINTAILFFFLPAISLAQLQVGINPGYIYYFFTMAEDDPHYSYDYDYTHNAFSIAASLNQRSENTFNPCFGIKYTNRSFTVNSTGGGLGGSTRKKYHYTIGNIFLQMKPEFVFGSRVKFFFYPGVGFGTLVHSSLDGTIYSGSMGEIKIDTINGRAKGYYPAFELNVFTGLGIEFPLNNQLSCVIDNSISMNVTPIAEAWGEEKIKMIDVNITVGFAYTFHRNKMKAVNQKD